MQEYDASKVTWRAPNNRAFGPSGLIVDYGTSKAQPWSVFSFATNHRMMKIPTEDGGSKEVFIFSLPKLYMDYMEGLMATDMPDDLDPDLAKRVRSCQSEEKFWKWLIPDAQVRAEFKKNKIVQKEMIPWKEEVADLQRGFVTEALLSAAIAGGKVPAMVAVAKLLGMQMSEPRGRPASAKAEPVEEEDADELAFDRHLKAINGGK